MMSRRSFGFALAIGLAPALAACNQQSNADLAHVADEIQAIITGLNTAMVQVQPLISANEQAQLQTLLANIKTAAATVAQAATTTAAQAPVSQIVTWIAVFSASLPSYNLPANVQTTVADIMAAVQVMIPIIAANVGIAAASARPPRMSEEQAKAILVRNYGS